MRQPLPGSSVRGAVRAYIERHADKLGDDVLEVGCRLPRPGCWWAVNRDLAQGAWLGIDMQQGDNVDRVADVHNLPADWAGRFSGVLCSEVLEHVARPWVALPKIREVIRPGGWVVITVPFCFPVHAYPDDYWRMTPSGLRELLQWAGFTAVETEQAGIEVTMMLNDHGEPGYVRKRAQIHTCGIARC